MNTNLVLLTNNTTTGYIDLIFWLQLQATK